MSNITKSIKRIQQDIFKKVVYMVIEKVQDQTMTEEQIMEIIEECMQKLMENEKTQRGRSGYNVFVSEKSAEMKEQQGDKVSFKDLSKTIGQMWKEMSEEEKDVYREKAKSMPVEQKKICSGTKGNGDPCTNKTKEGSEFCGQHLPKETKETEENMCQAKTKKGSACTRKAQEGQDLCKMHLIKSSTTDASSTSSEKKKCQGLTKTKDPCKRNALVGDYCKKHAEIYGFEASEEAVPEKHNYPKTVQIGNDKANLFTYKNKQYYLGEDDNVCYNAATHAEVGFWDAEEEVIIYN